MGWKWLFYLKDFYYDELVQGFMYKTFTPVNSLKHRTSLNTINYEVAQIVGFFLIWLTVLHPLDNQNYRKCICCLIFPPMFLFTILEKARSWKLTNIIYVFNIGHLKLLLGLWTLPSPTSWKNDQNPTYTTAVRDLLLIYSMRFVVK